MNNLDHLQNIRHTCAHLLAAAVLELFPDTKHTIGPAIKNGFYYDFDFSNSIKEEDLSIIEKKMANLLKTWKEFTHREIAPEEAKKIYRNNPYKLELIDEIIKKNEKITLYKIGNFEDLCRGGHSENPQKNIVAFKLLSIAGAYWRGNEKNKMLTRIYGACFESKKELENYLQKLEDAKKRDHRKLGKELDIFLFAEEVGAGLPILLPKGETIKHTLMQTMRQLEIENGYQYISAPVIASEKLYQLSGHQKYYHEDMYQIIDKEKKLFYIKAMDCPHHHMVFRHLVKSFRQLPLRLAEPGTVYRNELSGVLTGLIRVRGPITQNDSHIYCEKNQLADEIKKVLDLLKSVYKLFNMQNLYWFRLSLPDFTKNPDKYGGDKNKWEFATQTLREVMNTSSIKFIETTGEAAFYGPKIDVQMESVLGKDDTIATIQIDVLQPEWMNLSFINSNGQEEKPYIIHRAILGSYERFIGFLLEHYAGALPLWIAPVQTILLPIADRHNNYATKINHQLLANNIRSQIDLRPERLQAKIREATLQKAPFMGIIGDKEAASDQITVRARTGEDLGSLKLLEFLQKLKENIDKKR